VLTNRKQAFDGFEKSLKTGQTPLSDKNGWKKISRVGQAGGNPCYPVEWLKRFIFNVSGIVRCFH
jgi:hypothetical protein